MGEVRGKVGEGRRRNWYRGIELARPPSEGCEEPLLIIISSRSQIGH
jgi:hypothetical protein